MFEINNRAISINQPPYIIAELSANHNGSIELAKKSIKAAKESGADAIKIQTYTPDTMTINSSKDDFIIKKGLWKGYKLYDLYNEAHTPFEWHKDLFEYSRKIGIDIFSSPFDESAVDLLEDLDVPAFKIASFELCDHQLIKYIAKKNKPMLLSTGMASLDEIKEAVLVAQDNGCSKLLLFHCISAYPAPLEEANLKNILHLRKEFKLEVGLSDHTLGNIASLTAVALGATAIEKHFTISRKNNGPDTDFSIEPKELQDLKQLTEKTWLALGSEKFIRSKSEKDNKSFRRSLYFVRDLKKGQKISSNDVRRIRPGFGLQPKFESDIIGKIVKQDIHKGDRVTFDVLQ